jgi:hypothetical protein
MQVGRRGVQTTVVAAVASMSITLSACGSSQSAAPPTTRAKPATTTSIPAATTTLDPTAAAVLSAYRAGWAAFEQALSTADAADPALAATMVAPMLQEVRRNLVSDQVNGIVGRGGVQLHPRVAHVTATSATVVDCSYSTSELVYSSSGKPVPPVTPPEHDGVLATLTFVGATWKVSDQTVTEGTCGSGS